MAILRDFALIHTVDQWSRAAYWQTALDVDKGIVHLAWQTEAAVSGGADALPTPAGLAFDPRCRLYHALPEAGQVERYYWDEAGKISEPHQLFYPPATSSGGFQPQEAPTALQQPTGLAIDDDGHLFIAETGASSLLIYELLDYRLVQRLTLRSPPVDVCSDGQHAYALTNDAVVKVTARGKSAYIPLPDSLIAPSRIAVTRSAEIYVLDQAGTADARIIPLAREDEWLALPFAGHMVFSDEETVVIARRAGEDLLRFKIEPGLQWQLPHLKALHYDGRGIVLTLDGEIGYWTAKGFRRATRARLKFLNEGRIVGFQLDCDEYQNQWGRLFIDACIPRGTSVSVACLVMDEVPENSGPALSRTPPENAAMLTVHRPDLSPPMPPAEMLDDLEFYPLHRRDRGGELPWLDEDEDNFATYEAPVIEEPGRFLWLVLQLKGSSQFTPKLRSVRIEHQAHDLLRRLPKLYSRDAVAADFLRRYLAIMEGAQRDLDQQAARRHLMLDPESTPAELLPWLASFVGLVIDRRWSESVRRRVVEEAIWLFRHRGTIKGLKRFLDLYLEMADQDNGGVIIIEHYQVRGLGGAFVGESDAEAANSVLGAGFRIGGRIGSEEEISINETSLLDAFTTHAHRFSVVLPINLDAERLAVVETILEQHRPAHTIYDICSVDTGMRIGSGLHIGLNSLVGNSSGFGRIRVGDSCLGRSDILGRPRQGLSVGNDLLGRATRVG